MEERLKNLEVKYSHVDHLLDELNKIVMNQQISIDKLQNEILEIRRSQSTSDVSTRSLADDVPPHY